MGSCHPPRAKSTRRMHRELSIQLVFWAVRVPSGTLVNRLTPRHTRACMVLTNFRSWLGCAVEVCSQDVIVRDCCPVLGLDWLLTDESTASNGFARKGPAQLRLRVGLGLGSSLSLVGASQAKPRSSAPHRKNRVVHTDVSRAAPNRPIWAHISRVLTHTHCETSVGVVRAWGRAYCRPSLAVRWLPWTTAHAASLSRPVPTSPRSRSSQLLLQYRRDGQRSISFMPHPHSHPHTLRQPPFPAPPPPFLASCASLCACSASVYMY